MDEAVDLKYTTNVEYRHKKFSYGTEDTDAVALTSEEIQKLYKHDFSSDQRLERVRDLFIFGCFSGLRYGDFSQVKPEHIVKRNGSTFIRMKTRKTDEEVIVPCNDTILEIFKKYKSNPNSLPKAISAQKFNDYLKQVCEAAGLNETGRLLTKPELKLYECVTSHTARRSAITNWYLSGFPAIDLMRISGHRTERSFMTYIKISKQQVAERLAAHVNLKKMKAV